LRAGEAIRGLGRPSAGNPHPSGPGQARTRPTPEEDFAVSERAAPQYCPYCGDEDLRPEVLSEDKPEASHGVWLCRACARVFKLSFAGLSAPSLGRATGVTAR
jgi:hypothetical protein